MKAIHFLRHTTVAALVLATICSQADAALILNVGDISLLPNTAGQVVSFSLTNTDFTGVLVESLEFNLQVADGGPGVGGVTNAPTITAVDLATGTIFAFNNVGGTVNNGLPPQAPSYSILTTNMVPPPGGSTVSIPSGSSQIALVTFDTTGFNSGSWPLYMSSLAFNGTTKYGVSVNLDPTDIIPVITDGTLTINAVPEPEWCAVVAGVFFTGFAWVRRRRSAH